MLGGSYVQGRDWCVSAWVPVQASALVHPCYDTLQVLPCKLIDDIHVIKRSYQGRPNATAET